MNEDIVLLNFLKSAFSTRKLDAMLGFSKSKGWKSWDILKKYNLTDCDKGKLFLYTENQSKKFIKKIMEKKDNLENLIKNNPPTNLQKYRDIFIIAKSEKALYSAFSGETRNIVRDFFSPQKKLASHCQFFNCNNKNIDTVHLIKDRPQIFMEGAAKNKVTFEDSFKYDIYQIMIYFLQTHAKSKSICFLCKNHHNELHKLERKSSKRELNEFKNQIKI